jgi:hypothetical protein
MPTETSIYIVPMTFLKRPKAAGEEVLQVIIPRLFLAQRGHRIDSGGASRWEQSGSQCD